MSAGRRKARHFAWIGALIAGSCARTASADLQQRTDATPEDIAPPSAAPPITPPDAVKDEPKKPRLRVDRHPPPNRDAAPPPGSLFAKRPVPDYDGRGEDPTTAGDVLLWVPRILVLPFYVFTEFVVRRPLGAILSSLEQDKRTRRAFGFLSTAEDRPYSFIPSFNVDLGFLPAIGLHIRWDDPKTKKDHLRLHAETWGPDRMSAMLVGKHDLSESANIALRASFSRRTDNLFWGLGPSSRTATKSVYTAAIGDIGPMASVALTPALRISTRAGVRATRFLPSDDDFDDDEDENEPDEANEVEEEDDDEQSIRQRVRRGVYAAPPRFQDGHYTLAYQSLEVVLDSRIEKQGASKSGVRLAANAQPAFDVSQRPGVAWLAYSAAASGHWEIIKPRRVLSLSLNALFVDPLNGGGGGARIPFTELATLGGFDLMRGFLPGRLIDRSAAVATLTYEWPVWSFVDANLQVAAGNVFGAGLGDFKPGKLRLSTGLGLRTTPVLDQQFEIFGGLGTEPFDEGASITSGRLLFGATRAF